MGDESPHSSSSEHVTAETPLSSSPRQRKPVEEITDPLVLAASLFEELRKIKETLQQGKQLYCRIFSLPRIDRTSCSSETATNNLP
uniref:Uncharacterized protein n=1 Tax=Ascaris lumbricoides TaxID=6252 RepID=A0A0M3IH46_ASCLU